MAVSDDIKRQREKLKDKSLREKVSYYVGYYWIQGIIAIVTIGFVIALIKTVAFRKDSALNVIFLNAAYSQTVGETAGYDTLMEEFPSYAKIDLEKYDLTIDMSTRMTPGVVKDSYDMASSEKLAAQAATGTLDAVVADASNFYFYCFAGAFDDLRNVMSEEELSSYEGRIFYIDGAEYDAYREEVNTAEGAEDLMSAEEGKAWEMEENFTLPDPSTMTEPIPAGILVSDEGYLKEMNLYPGTVAVMGFSPAAPNTENAKKFLTYLLEH